jgi:uncharacterized protein DUF4277
VMDTRRAVVNVGEVDLVRRRVGALPVVNHVLDRLRLAEIVDRYVPCDDARLKVTPAQVVGVLVRNLLLGHRPGYAVGGWAARFDPALFGLTATQIPYLSDDRVGRVLDRLFDADRASLFTELIVGMVAEFGVGTDQVHNDSTTVTPKGLRPDRGGGARGGKAVPALKHGHNKDYRPDLPQLLFILTTSADGAVPLLHWVTDGNTSDDKTHIDTWNSLVKLLGRSDFLYVADSKLCTREQMDHIHAHQGRFVTILPRSRGEDRYFRREWLPTHTPTWTEVRRRPGPRQGDPDDVWWAFTHPQPSSEGYRIIWIKSNRRIATDAEDRDRRIRRAVAGLDDLNERLAAPRSRTRDLLAADTSAEAVIKEAGATAWITRYAEPIKDHSQRRPRYRGKGIPRVNQPHFVINYEVDHIAVTRDALADGCYPTITNTRDLTEAQVLDALKHQPHLERRNHVFKTDQAVMPIHLQRPHRIEALLSCHFIALLVGALIERQIRQTMIKHQIQHLNLYPEDRPCTAPSTSRILELFSHLTRDVLVDQTGQPIRTFQPDLEPIHEQILDLLAIPASNYRP